MQYFPNRLCTPRTEPTFFHRKKKSKLLKVTTAETTVIDYEDKDNVFLHTALVGQVVASASERMARASARNLRNKLGL